MHNTTSKLTMRNEYIHSGFSLLPLFLVFLFLGSFYDQCLHHSHFKRPYINQIGSFFLSLTVAKAKTNDRLIIVSKESKPLLGKKKKHEKEDYTRRKILEKLRTSHKIIEATYYFIII